MNTNVKEKIVTYQDSDFGSIRVLLQDNDVLFCLKDLCNILEIKNAANIKQSLNREFEKSGRFRVYPLMTNGGEQIFTFINEPELYHVLLTSKKPKAKDVRLWLIYHVLPAIRQDDFYKEKEFSCKEVLDKLIHLAEYTKKLLIKNELLEQSIKEKDNFLNTYRKIESEEKVNKRLRSVLNREIKFLAEIKFNNNFIATYKYIYDIFKAKHNFKDKKINIDFISKNNQYLQECLEIVYKETNRRLVFPSW